MNLAHLHLLLNHVPTVGLALGLGLFLAALVAKNDDLKRVSLEVFVVIALLALPAYLSGNAAQEAIADLPDVSEALIATHQDAALLAFVFMMITGAVAWIGLWQFRRISRPAFAEASAFAEATADRRSLGEGWSAWPRRSSLIQTNGGGPSRWTLSAVLLLSIVTVGLMARAAIMGDEIRHPEIRSGQETTATEGTAGLSASTASFVVGETWVWPASETLHFIGLCLLFGVVLLVNLRMLGMMKSVSVAALHRLLPWAIVGFGINAITGMLFFIGAPQQYTQNVAFHWKIVLMLLAGGNVLYLTVFDGVRAVGPGDDAPLTAKVIAASAIFLWIGVIYCGRMLPFIGNAF